MSGMIVGILLVATIIVSGWFIVTYNIVTNYKITAVEDRERLLELLKKRNDLFGEYIDCSILDNGLERKIFEFLLEESSILNSSKTCEEIKKSDETIKQRLNSLLMKCELIPGVEGDEGLKLIQMQLAILEESLNKAYRSYEKSARELDKFMSIFPNKAVKLVLGLKTIS